jgi:hypothetical protein
MSAIFEMPIDSEMLSSDEIGQITGCGRKSDQIEWLSCNGWTFHKTRAGEPVVGRLYARLKMAGITPATLAPATGWVPDFSGIR